jgi:hypothetical protein
MIAMSLPLQMIAEILADANVPVETWVTFADLYTCNVIKPCLQNMNDFNKMKSECLRTIAVEFVSRGICDKDELNLVLAYHDAELE